MISTIPYALSNFRLRILCETVRQLLPRWDNRYAAKFLIDNAKFFLSRVNFNSSLIGGIAETQEVMNLCADNGIYPQIQMIAHLRINTAWE